MEPTGDFVAVWASPQDGSGYGVYAQRYNASGVPQGGEFRVNTYTTNGQTSPSVAMDDHGNFVVVWESYGQQPSFSSPDVFAQRKTLRRYPGQIACGCFAVSRQPLPRT